MGITSYVDPGVVTKDNEAFHCSLYAYDDVTNTQKDCETCHISRPARSKHCRICNRYFLKRHMRALCKSCFLCFRILLLSDSKLSAAAAEANHQWSFPSNGCQGDDAGVWQDLTITVAGSTIALACTTSNISWHFW